MNSALIPLLFSLAAPGFSPVIPSSASPAARLVKIQVLGSKRFKEAQIIRAAGLKLRAPATPQTFKEAANRLAATGAFADVGYRYQQAGAGLAVVFRVSDAAKFYPCRFNNLVWFTPKELQDELGARVPLFTGEVALTGNLPDQLDAALADLLKSRGIPGTVHHTMYARQGGPIEAIQFSVRGAAVLIRRIDFEGATQADAKALQAAVQPLLGQDYDQSFALAFAENNLSPLYWERGYLRVGFDGPKAALLQDAPPATNVVVTIPVREGLQYRLAEIRWSGNSVFSAGDLAKYIHLRSGEPANAVELQRDLESIHDAYGARGYLRAAVESKPTLDDAARAASYALEVHEGDLYRLGRLGITGVDPAHAQALVKICRLRAGDPYNRDYWRTFTSESVRHLPRQPNGWQVSFNQSINDTAKTVDVTVGFAPQ